MKLGYIRVSTKEQNPSRQIDELLKHGIDERYIFIDKQSGRSMARPQYEALKLVLRAGDELYIHELDRLGRNKQQVLEELKSFKETGIIVRILDIPTTLMDFQATGDMTINILDMINTLLIEVYSTLAEHEYKKIKKRQAEGISAAKQAGVKFGRPLTPITDDFISIYRVWKQGLCTATEAMKQLNLKKTTFYTLVRRYENKT